MGEYREFERGIVFNDSCWFREGWDADLGP
jgi:hypothetical protein